MTGGQLQAHHSPKPRLDAAWVLGHLQHLQPGQASKPLHLPDDRDLVVLDIEVSQRGEEGQGLQAAD